MGAEKTAAARPDTGAEETAAARADTGAEETAAARADTGAEETAAALPDIATREDCAALVRAFYTRALADEVIGFIFTDVAQLDLEHHLPRITRFWETVLLGAGTYGGGAFRPHLELNQQVPLRRGHFERWLWLWQGTVDALYAGPVADAAKRHAARVATAFSGRIEAINAGRLDPGPDVASPPGRAGADAPRLTVTQVRATRRPG